MDSAPIRREVQIVPCVTARPPLCACAHVSPYARELPIRVRVQWVGEAGVRAPGVRPGVIGRFPVPAAVPTRFPPRPHHWPPRRRSLNTGAVQAIRESSGAPEGASCPPSGDGAVPETDHGPGTVTRVTPPRSPGPRPGPDGPPGALAGPRPIPVGPSPRHSGGDTGPPPDVVGCRRFRWPVPGDPETRGPRARGRGPDPRDASSMGPPSTARAARCRRSPRVRRDRSDRSVRRSSTRWCVRAATYGIEVSCEAPPYIDAPALVRTHQRQLTGTCKLFVMPRNGTREASGSLFTT